MVSPEEEEVLRELDLVREKEADGLEAPFPPVHVVAEEEVVCLRREAPVPEDPQEVVELPMDVPAEVQRGLQLQQHGLVHEDLPRLDAEEVQRVWGQLHYLARRMPVPDHDELVQDRVNVNL
mmetsp:Transcript_86966/g.130386  ORF Transcript_86966/g.130386 Transcript_86966/m.130386 type:complete len:122 (+) Transcript_86966:483-848(+)